jgi:cytochrome c peroxidase
MVLMAAASLIMGCGALSEPTDVTPLFVVPAHFPSPIRTDGEALCTPERVALGRALFYDEILSRDATVSCASCHQQNYAFTQHGHRVSHGVEDRLGTRNSLPLQNLAWQPSFLWDGGVHNLDLFPPLPISNPVEMDLSMDSAMARLRNSPRYRVLMRAAEGDDSISTSRVLKAFSAFMLTMISSTSPYDDALVGRTQRTSEQERGNTLFQQHCTSCHVPPLFTDHSFRNTGLLPSVVDDRGRATITLDPRDAYAFKVPSLRNVEVTGPYSHDGRYRTLREAVAHYRDNVTALPGVDPAVAGGLALSEREIDDIVAFLRTLTDRSFLINKALGPP